MKLMTTMFQNLFPSLNIQKVNLFSLSCQQCFFGYTNNYVWKDLNSTQMSLIVLKNKYLNGLMS